jgi:hypothetical protein
MAAAAVSRAVQAISSGSSKLPNAGASPLPEASCSSFVEEVVSGNLRHSDSDSDFEFYDNDYDVEDGDDDLFADNVDKSVGDNNEKEMVDDKEDEDALDYDTLQLGEENMEVLRNKLTEFNSNNTQLLSVKETKEKIASLTYIQEELAKGTK